MAEKQAETISPRIRRGGIAERLPWSDVPLGLVPRLADEIDHLFEDFGVLPKRMSTRLGRQLWGMLPTLRGGQTDLASWTPDVDMFQRGHDLVVRVDLPGLKKEDVDVHITDDGVNIRGERRTEYEIDEGVYRRERSFGVINRYIAVPEGAMTDQAKASFRDGVLEIVMPAPPEPVTRGRRLEISDRLEKK